MAYMRGDTYVWSDGSRVHLWAHDGYDYWDDSIWACADDENRRDDRYAASGVCLPADVLDELAVMLVAKMVDEGTLAATVERAITKWAGDDDCVALMRLAGNLTQRLGSHETNAGLAAETHY